MIALTRHSRSPLLRIALCALITGCSSLSSGGSLRESELAIIPTEPSTSFSRTAQGDISELNLGSEQLADPSGLEANEQFGKIQAPARRSLLISEAWYLRGQNDLEVPLPVSLERFLRAAHFSYEGIFGESGCEDVGGQLCADLTIAYNRSVREVARLTNNGTQLQPSSDSRYVVDVQEDRDPLTLSEWEITFDDTNGTTRNAFGAPGTGCQELASENSGLQHHARQCVPVAFVVTFENRVNDARGRAHLAAFNTLYRADIELHGRTVALASTGDGPWREIFAPRLEAPLLTCLGNAHADLPTVLFLTPSTQTSYEWPVVGAAVSNEPLLLEHYNFCAMSPSSSESISSQAQVEQITGALSTLMPHMKRPAQIIFITQGAPGEDVVKGVKGALKDVTPGALAPLTIGGTLSFPAPRPLAPNTYSIPISSTKELSRPGSIALADIKRLLTRLADPEDGIFGGLTRSNVAASPDGRLSPVM